MVCAKLLDLLVVEDDADDFFLEEELLRSEFQARIRQASSVEEALGKLSSDVFDVILLDYSLGARNGLDLLDELRQRDIASPVILLTGRGDEDLAVRALKAGAVDYLSKGRLNAASLATAVRHALVLREKDEAVRAARVALCARERDYRMLFESANDAILIIDPESETLVEANGAACRLYGCSHDELVGRSLIEYSTDVVRGRAAIDDCVHLGRLSNFETVHVARDGRHVHILANASLIEYQGKRALLSVFRDISERKAAEQEIFRLNRALKALSKCSEALLHARDQQQLLDEICQIVVQNGGYRLAWVAGAPDPPADCIRPLASHGTTEDASQAWPVQDYVETLCLRFNASSNSELLVPTTLRTGKPAVCRDASTDPRSASLRQECEERGFASILALPIEVEGNAFGVLAIYAAETDAFDAPEVELLSELARNVVFGLESLQARQQKETAQNDLRASEQRYRTLFERNLAGVFRARADGTILEGNESFVHMLGYDTSTEMIGLGLGKLCTAAGFAEPWLRELAGAGQLINREIRILRKDGAIACLLANLALLRDLTGSPESIEGTVLDITERRQLEAQLLQSQKMEAIGQLAGGIAHDFNNLLMVMRSHAELAAEAETTAQAPGKSGDYPSISIQHELDAILKATDRGAVLTRQLLTFGRKQLFSPRLLDINSVLDTITKVLPRALGEDVRVQLRGAPDLWQVKADPVQIEQLVLNLAVNARDAMPGGGRLTLETSNVVLDTDYVRVHARVAPGEYVMLAVTDSGLGIPPEVLPRIFEPFFTTKERGKGTGLGLSTVYGIVQQSGGFIWVYSEPQGGTVFKIYLPRAGATRQASLSGTPGRQVSRASAPAAADRGTETILLVEDEEAVRAAACKYLSLRGYRVLEAANGEEALRISDSFSGRIDLVVTDAVMPGMNGSVLGQMMALRRPGIPVMYVSGYTEATIGEHGITLGRPTLASAPGTPASAFLQKPFSLAVLAQKVREVLSPAVSPSDLPEDLPGDGSEQSAA